MLPFLLENLPIFLYSVKAVLLSDLCTVQQSGSLSVYESPRELEEEQEEEISLADLFPDPADFVPASPTFTFPPLPPSPPDAEVKIQIFFIANLQNILSNF